MQLGHLLSKAALIAGLVASTSAFQDTAPGILLSVTQKELLADGKSNSANTRAADGSYIESSTAFLQTVRTKLHDFCSSGTAESNLQLLWVHQPGLHVSDLKNQLDAPFLASVTQLVSAESSNDTPEDVFDSSIVPNVHFKAEEVAKFEQEVSNIISAECGNAVETGKVSFFSLAQGELGSSCDRKKDIKLMDAVLRDRLGEQKTNYLMLVTAVPSTSSKVKSFYSSVKDEAQSALEGARNSGDHLASLLKDQLGIHKRSSQSISAPDNLLTHYSFFTPGIWMTTLIGLFLAFVFSIALNWVSALDISYKAFDKPPDYVLKKAQ